MGEHTVHLRLRVTTAHRLRARSTAAGVRRRSRTGCPEDPEWLLAPYGRLRTARCENHYNVGWAWALDAPFQWMKQVASTSAGPATDWPISWPAGSTTRWRATQPVPPRHRPGSTILDAAGIAEPSMVNGIEQKPIEGVSMRYSSPMPRRKAEEPHSISRSSVTAPSTTTVGSFRFHGRLPWIRTRVTPFGDIERWTASTAISVRRSGCGTPPTNSPN